MARTSGQGHTEETRSTAVFAVSAGASREIPLERRGLITRRSSTLFTAGVLAVLSVAGSTACAGEDSAPGRLMDDSEPPGLPIELQGVESPAVLTKVSVVPASEHSREPRSATCLSRGRGSTRARASAVERVGVRSETVTFEEESGSAVFGCDNSPGPREAERRWCGGAYGQLYGGHLRDPRLDIGGCRTDENEPIAFIWMEPGRATRYVAVRQPDFTEVYEPAGGLPVRIATTSGFASDPLGVTINLTEHDATGKLLSSRRVDAVPAG